MLNGFHDSRGVTHIREIHGALKDRGLRDTGLRHFHGEWVESRLPSPMKAMKLTAVGAGRVKVSGWWAAWPRMAWGSHLLQRCPSPTALITFSWPSSASLAVWPCCRESTWIWSYLAAKCVPEREARAITKRHFCLLTLGPEACEGSRDGLQRMWVLELTTWDLHSWIPFTQGSNHVSEAQLPHIKCA